MKTRRTVKIEQAKHNLKWFLSNLPLENFARAETTMVSRLKLLLKTANISDERFIAQIALEEERANIMSQAKPDLSGSYLIDFFLTRLITNDWHSIAKVLSNIRKQVSKYGKKKIIEIFFGKEYFALTQHGDITLNRPKMFSDFFQKAKNIGFKNIPTNVNTGGLCGGISSHWLFLKSRHAPINRIYLSCAMQYCRKLTCRELKGKLTKKKSRKFITKLLAEAKSINTLQNNQTPKPISPFGLHCYYVKYLADGLTHNSIKNMGTFYNHLKHLFAIKNPLVLEISTGISGHLHAITIYKENKHAYLLCSNSTFGEEIFFWQQLSEFDLMFKQLVVKIKKVTKSLLWKAIFFTLYSTKIDPNFKKAVDKIKYIKLENEENEDLTTGNQMDIAYNIWKELISRKPNHKIEQEVISLLENFLKNDLTQYKSRKSKYLKELNSEFKNKYKLTTNQVDYLLREKVVNKVIFNPSKIYLNGKELLTEMINRKKYSLTAKIIKMLECNRYNLEEFKSMLQKHLKNPQGRTFNVNEEYNGHYLISLAVFKGRIRIVKYFVEELGANTKVRSKIGTPLEIAQNRGYPHIARYFSKRKGENNSKFQKHPRLYAKPSPIASDNNNQQLQDYNNDPKIM